MEILPELLRMLLALAVVVLLMMALAAVMRRSHSLQKYFGGDAVPRMKVMSTLVLDARHRLVIVRIDDREKTFLLSPESAQEVSA